jgi:23S rRNA (cytosine1962-C5)-methyltransferase
VLDWGAENAELNGQPASKEDFLAGDVFEWLKRLSKKDQRFDVVILDPPSFSTSKGGRFSAAKDYPRLVEQAAAVLAPKGLLLACCNLALLEPSRFELQVREGLLRAHRKPGATQRLGASPIDFPGSPDEPPPLKVLAVEVP